MVLGMHRSGTSAVSGVLASLGAQPPRNLLPQAKDNEKGFWESAELVKFHDRILASSGSRWNDWEEFNPDWVDSVVAEQFMELLPPLIEQEFGDARLLLLKDPRMCRFVPFWLKALERLEITPRVVVPLRRPSEVARSLQVRNGFGSSRAMLMWLRHVLDVELSTRWVTRSFIRYDELLGDWRVQAKKIGNDLDVKWPRWSSSVEIEIDNYLSDELRHHKHGDEIAGVDHELLGWITRTSQALGQLVDSSGPQADEYAILDEVRLTLGRSSAIYATVVREHEIKADGEVAKFKWELEAKSKELSESIRQLNEQADQRCQKLDATEKDAARLSALVAAHEVRLEALMQTTESQARELLACEADASILRVTQAEEKQAYAATILDHEQLLQARDAELDSLRLAAQQSFQLTSERELELAKCRAEVEAVKASEKQLIEFRSQADMRLAEIKAIVTQLAMENGALTVRNLEQTTSLEERYKEIARLTKLLIAKEREAQARLVEHRNVTKRQEAELKKLNGDLTLMRQSWSWRAGSPIRRARKLLKGMRTGQTSDEARMLKDSGWLDATWYVDRYPDVAESGIDPAVHYLEFGAMEGRDPGPKFDTNFYTKTYADVAASGINPLLHFIQHGQGENRKPR